MSRSLPESRAAGQRPLRRCSRRADTFRHTAADGRIIGQQVVEDGDCFTAEKAVFPQRQGERDRHPMFPLQPGTVVGKADCAGFLAQELPDKPRVQEDVQRCKAAAAPHLEDVLQAALRPLASWLHLDFKVERSEQVEERFQLGTGDAILDLGDGFLQTPLLAARSFCVKPLAFRASRMACPISLGVRANCVMSCLFLSL